MKFFLTLILIIASLVIKAQTKYNSSLLDTLDFISNTKTPAKHFALLYYNAITVTNSYAAALPENERLFIFGFESFFAPAFFRSYHDFTSNRQQAFSWQRYYADTSLNELQYQFMGMNAHINGDMGEALKNKYNYDTLKKYRRTLIRFQKVLNQYFDSIYNTSHYYKKIRQLHFFTLGVDKYIGRHMILHWRKRQVGLALQFYLHPAKYERRWMYIKKRMLHYDRFAKRFIK